MIATPRDAATVMLLRNGSVPGEGIEVLMVRRHAGSRFVPDAFVFPGGQIEPADCSAEIEACCHQFDVREAHLRMPDMSPPERALGACVAALRETFEEVGILLVCTPGGATIRFNGTKQARLEQRRRALHAHRITLAEVLREEELRLAPAQLHYFAHWITPEASPIRYDVRFFAAAAPRDQTARHDGVELTGHRWVTPSDALAEHARGVFPMVLPTRTLVGELMQFPTVEAAVGSTRDKDIPAVLSRMIIRDGHLVEVLPGAGDDRGLFDFPGSISGQRPA